jgi:hypothetical protein
MPTTVALSFSPAEAASLHATLCAACDVLVEDLETLDPHDTAANDLAALIGEVFEVHHKVYRAMHGLSLADAAYTLGVGWCENPPPDSLGGQQGDDHSPESRDR